MAYDRSKHTKKAQADSFAEGKIEGKSERSTEIATNLLLEGCDVDVIERATGLSRADILSLKNEIKRF